jgi:hypothetical protein
MLLFGPLQVISITAFYGGCPNQEIRLPFLFTGLITVTCSYFAADFAALKKQSPMVIFLKRPGGVLVDFWENGLIWPNLASIKCTNARAASQLVKCQCCLCLACQGSAHRLSPGAIHIGLRLRSPYIILKNCVRIFTVYTYIWAV